MADLMYTASKTKTQDRPGWTVSFRHPLRTDANGSPGRKVRKGLGTTDADEADRLVAQLNGLLRDSSWWSAAKREEAERTFDRRITAAFYDGLQAGMPDSWDIRNEHIRILDPSDGYCRVLLVGATGAGKTSLLRQLIGSDPVQDRFPSTSTAKTTISDIEVVLARGAYSAVVTFFSEFWVQTNLEECVVDACTTWWETQSRAKTADRLLNHRDQRFRLSYALGTLSRRITAASDEAWAFDGDPAATPEFDDEVLSRTERERNRALLNEYLDEIVSLSERCLRSTNIYLGDDIRDRTGLEREEAYEAFEESVRDDEAFDALLKRILEQLKRKFRLPTRGHFQFHSSGWPSKWVFETRDRAQFIQEVRFFSSNTASQFGRLLTPFVDGLRIRGPLFPQFADEHPNLVLFDGQGLGHTPDSAASVTTQITRRFATSDVILLVDNAQQPMQAASISVLRAAVTGGHERKLAVALTHFDRVGGSNLPNFSLKKAHVLASVANGLSALNDAVGLSVIRGIERTIEDRCFLFGALDRRSSTLPPGVVGEFERMFAFFAEAIEPEDRREARPSYNPDGLLLALQEAARGFRRIWESRLGLRPGAAVHSEHWTRVKALTRRISSEIDVEYDTLRPVADFLSRLTEEISRFLERPAKWRGRAPSDEEADATISSIRRQIYDDLHKMVAHRLLAEHLSDWRSAYRRSGGGSARERARDVNSIYESGAPIISTLMSEDSEDLVREVRSIVYGAIRQNGGDLDTDD